MNSDRNATDENAELATMKPRSESHQPAARGDEAQERVVLNCTSFLLVRQTPGAADPEFIESPLIVAASQDGLDELGSLDDVSQIWLVRLTEDGGLHTDPVMHLRYWPLDREGTCLTAVFCKSGALFIAAPDDLIEVDEPARQWFTKPLAERGHSAIEQACSAQRASHAARHG